MFPSLTRQPWKGIYTVFYTLVSLIHISVLAIYYLVPAKRPRRSWTFKGALVHNFIKKLWYYYGVVEEEWRQNLESGRDNDKFELISPVPKKLLHGPLVDNDVEPATVGGLWIPNRYEGKQADDASVILYFHGGAYVANDARGTLDCSGLALFCKKLPAVAACSIEYRLANNLKWRFPAQLHDALSAYRFLIEEKNVSASRIILMGDSAGSHLCISLIRYLSFYSTGLDLPGAAILSSPWVDLTVDGCTTEGKPRAYTDHLPGKMLRWGARCFVPPGMARDDAWISPLNHPFVTQVPIWVEVGTAEVLYDSIIAWVEQMKAMNDKKTIRRFEFPDGVHSSWMACQVMDTVHVQEEAIRDAQAFLEVHLHPRNA